MAIPEELQRTGMLLGQAGIDALRAARVAVIGLGGVGGTCAEALARAGVGCLLVLDGDVVERSNLNRQLIATKSTLGLPKAQAMRQRLEAVSNCRVEAVQAVLRPDNIEALLPGEFDFLVDAVDMVSAKLALAGWAQARRVPIIASMGTGNRLDPSQLYITDIYRTEGCPLARAVRKGCREKGIAALPVVMSREAPLQHVYQPAPEEGRHPPASSPFVPPAAGLLLASYVVRMLTGARQGPASNLCEQTSI